MEPGKEKMESQSRLERIELEVFRSLKVSEEEIRAVASSPDLYARLRSRIERGPRRERSESALSRWGMRFVPIQRSVIWTFAAAAAVLLVVTTLLFWRPKPSVLPGETGQFQSPRTPSAPQQEPERRTSPQKPESDTQLMAKSATSPNSSRIKARRRMGSRATEVATEFFPLTFIADSAALETGHVVRVKVPRSALVSFGVPMNVDRVGELVKADVVIGDDGLARAIRFIQ